MDALFAEGFPEFITADREVKKYIKRVRELFTAFDIILVDDVDEPVATGWGVPIAWTADVSDLPESFADVLRRALELHDAAVVADTFVICGGVVHPERKGSGVATDLVRALCITANEHGLTKVIAPVRPTRKDRYPLMDIAEYAAWTRDDGLPWDPWLRLHVRMGGQIIALAPTAQNMIGSVAEWEQWTGLVLPASGEYIIERGMAPLLIDKPADLGVYTEPNVWVRHR
jgi:hypothetical protein